MRQRYYEQPAPETPDFDGILAALKHLSNSPRIGRAELATRQGMNKRFSHRANCVYCGLSIFGRENYLQHVLNHEQYRAWTDFYYQSRRDYQGLQQLKDEMKEKIAADKKQLGDLEAVAERLSQKIAVKERELKEEGAIDYEASFLVTSGFEQEPFEPVLADAELKQLREKLLDVKGKIHALDNQLSRKRFKARETEQKILQFEASEDCGPIVSGALVIPDQLLQVVSQPGYDDDVIPSGGHIGFAQPLEMQRVQSRQRALTRESDSTSTSALHDAARRLQR